MDPIAEEQLVVDECYERLGALEAHLGSRMTSVASAASTGTAQDLLERQALFDSLAQQEASARAARTRLCFGRVDLGSGDSHHIGRIGLRDDAGDPVLIDWRAPNAAGFYQATTVDPMGVTRRRRIITRDRTVTHIEDEDLSNPMATSNDAAAAAVDAPRDGRMNDIIATIAADQDRIIRSPMNRVTVVQGGPGTGKTVVALHRAAWLLYTHRERLAKDGVLVVGPSTTFLRYIDQVLPSLGETDVVLLTPGQLMPGISATAFDPPEVAAIKGNLAMARVIQRAVEARIRIPDHDVSITLEDGSTVAVTADQLAQARRQLPRRAPFHANREPFLRKVLDFLARDRARRRQFDPGDPDVRVDMVSEIVDDLHVRRTLNLMWLPIAPQALIDRLLSDPAELAMAAHGILSPAQQAALLRPAGSPWTVDDVPLLDEAAERLGEWSRPSAGSSSRHEDDPEELVAYDPHAVRARVPVAERALSDRTWVYGHVVVDEAQDLSRMAWRALSRRSARKSLTVVGDLQQASHPAAPRTWEEALDWAGDRIDLHVLTVTYRITKQTADTATAMLMAAGGSAPELHPIRDGSPTELLTTSSEALSADVREHAHGDDPARMDGRVGVIVPDSLADQLIRSLVLSSDAFGAGDDALDAPIAVITARQSKGLEFDHVFVIEPDLVAKQGIRGSDAYVACTRATQRLHLVSLSRRDG